MMFGESAWTPVKRGSEAMTRAAASAAFRTAPVGGAEGLAGPPDGGDCGGGVVAGVGEAGSVRTGGGVPVGPVAEQATRRDATATSRAGATARPVRQGAEVRPRA